MQTHLRIPILLLLLLATAASCNKDKTSELKGDWLFPIAKGDFSINSLSQLKNLDYQIEIPAYSIGQPVNILVSSPGIKIAHVGPFPVQITDWLHRVDIDTLAFSGTVNNFFPIPIGAGTIVTMRNTRDTIASNIVGSAVIDTTVMPGETFSFDILVANKTLGDSVYFFLDSFNSPPYNNVLFTSKPAQLNIRLKVITAGFVRIYTGKTFSSIDTAEFSVGDDDISSRTNGSLTDTSVSGIINIFTDNGLPANVRSQLYFLNESKTQILDSLFIPTLSIGGGLTDNAGNNTSINSTSTKVSVTRKKLDNLKLSKYMVSRFDFNTPASAVLMYRSAKARGSPFSSPAT